MIPIHKIREWLKTKPHLSEVPNPVHMAGTAFKPRPAATIVDPEHPAHYRSDRIIIAMPLRLFLEGRAFDYSRFCIETCIDYDAKHMVHLSPYDEDDCEVVWLFAEMIEFHNTLNLFENRTAESYVGEFVSTFARLEPWVEPEGVDRGPIKPDLAIYT